MNEVRDNIKVVYETLDIEIVEFYTEDIIKEEA